MRAIRIGLTKRTSVFFILAIAGSAGALPGPLNASHARAQGVGATLEKANVYIEVAKTTERAVESWDRYASWVNLKTGPTGKERYISYGMYEPHDIAGLLAEARKVSGAPPVIPELETVMARYLTSYEALAPVMTKAAKYYELEAYRADKAVEGQALHKQMVPLASRFLEDRKALMPPLRVFVRDAEEQEVADLEKREGRTAAWHVGNVMHTLNRVIDTFPRDRPQPMDAETFDAKMMELGPDSPGEKFDELIAGVVPPQNTTIDIKRFNEALGRYAEAVAALEAYSGEKPDDFDTFKPQPQWMLNMLRAFEGPLNKSEGREFDGGGQMVGQIVQAYFSMMNDSNGLWGSRLRYLP